MPPPPPLCRCCGVPLGVSDEYCIECQRHPPGFTQARALGLYLSGADGLNPLATAVQRLKYAGRRSAARPLGTLLAAHYPFGTDAVLVPVPLYVSRLRARGYNQAVLLARHLGHRLGLPVAPHALRRIRATRAQPGLDATARRQNMVDAFVVAAPESIQGRRVVLIDDVLTTGATASACARVLLAGGADRVDVYTAGRVP